MTLAVLSEKLVFRSAGMHSFKKQRRVKRVTFRSCSGRLLCGCVARSVELLESHLNIQNRRCLSAFGRARPIVILWSIQSTT